ncbi:MAG TPA: glycosyltransferase family 4 protein [Chthoniobacterales bacterium]|jgi:glycosyltransferase involved in cell wall biosynthesis|nr:glycosyltransferase family 4 protein [Chthoniobacterales bacterium]
MSQENLPNSVLYAISARIGGIGLDLVAHETIRGIEPFLGKAISYGVRAPDIDRRKMKTLRFHPVRLLSNLDRKYYYAAKKRAVDRVAAQFLKTGRFDLFHVWSGSALHGLRVAKSLGIPSLLEIPTWHRQKGKVLPPKTEHEIAMENAPIPQRWLNRLLISRQDSLEEYGLADLILVESEKAADSFRVLGFPDEKLYSMPQGVDVNRFQPGPPPPLFRAVFVGALIKRKGVHTLIEAWKKLRLPRAELWLAGHPHAEIKPYLVDLPSNVKVLGFKGDVENVFRAGSVHLFPSSLEGSAKTTYEAAACALAQITTREAGDVVVDGVNGVVIPPDDVDALAAAIQFLYDRPDLVRKYGAAGRKRVLEQFTWDHFRERVLAAYRLAMDRATESRRLHSVR